MDDKKSLLTTLPPLLVAAGTLITAVIGLGNFMSAPPAPSITEFDVSPSIMDAGGNATLKWAVSGEVSSVSIDPDIGVVALSGSRQIYPANTTSYTLTAKNKGQAKTASAQIVVREARPVQGGVNESNTSVISSIQKPAPSSAQSSNKNVGDEPVYNNVPMAPSANNNVESAGSADRANSANTVNTASTADAAKAAQETIKEESPAQSPTPSPVPSEPKSSASYSKNTGDEPILMSNLKSASSIKETLKRTNVSGESAVGDEPMQNMVPLSTSSKNASSKTFSAVNQTMPTKAVANAAKAPAVAKAQSNVGDIA